MLYCFPNSNLKGCVIMELERIGQIININQIELNKNIIISGTLNKCEWVHIMPGIFKKRNNDIIFVDHADCVTEVDNKINLSTFQEVQ